MKKILITLLVCLFVLSTIAQQKSKQKEKPPTKKEMDAMMKEAQGIMDETMKDMSPEDKKMMDSMGIKMPSMKSVPKVTVKQLANAWENENRIIPKKDAPRIAIIPKIPTSNAAAGTLINDIYNKTILKLKPASKTVSQKIYDKLKADGLNESAIGNTAAGLWMAGRIEPALYIMGKISMEDISNSDNINNYASMISMCGAEQSSIPLLNFLNAKFPNNSTLLNNLGQAWFGLGEIGKAEKYLDSAIRIYAYHPQANFTKSHILESRGDKSRAIEAMRKSILHAYTDEKENRLKKLGYKLTLPDVRLPFKPSTDPLGLARFKQPDYPKSVGELKALIPQWEAFDNDCQEKIAMLQKELGDAEIVLEQNLKSSTAQLMQAINTGGTIPASAQKPLYITQASLQLQEVVRHNEAKIIKRGEMHLALATQLDELQKNRKRAAPEAPCKDHINAENDFLSKCNALKKAYNDKVLQEHKLFLNDMAYWSQYTSIYEAQFEIIKLGFEIDWLMRLQEYRPLLTAHGYEIMADCAEEEESEPGKLAEFDDVACQYHSEMKLIVFTMKSDCSRMTTEIDAPFIKLGLKQNMDKENFSDQFVSCTVEVSAKVGKEIEVGPLTVGAEAGAGVGVEITRSGVSDVYVTAGASAGAGVGPVSVEAGVEGRISLISGNSVVSGTGILSGDK